EGLPKVTADRVQVQQVLLNLMLNSIEAMKDTRGELTVTSERTEDGALLVSVSDSGIGLAAEDVGHIFEAFFTRKSQGPAWDCPSVERLLSRTAAVCGQLPTRYAARLFISRCRTRRQHTHLRRLRHELYAFARLQFGTKKPAAQTQMAPWQAGFSYRGALKLQFLRRTSPSLRSTTPPPSTNCSTDWNNHGNGVAVGFVPSVP